jgi:hypothetical protein
MNSRAKRTYDGQTFFRGMAVGKLEVGNEPWSRPVICRAGGNLKVRHCRAQYSLGR